MRSLHNSVRTTVRTPSRTSSLLHNDVAKRELETARHTYSITSQKVCYDKSQFSYKKQHNSLCASDQRRGRSRADVRDCCAWFILHTSCSCRHFYGYGYFRFRFVFPWDVMTICWSLFEFKLHDNLRKNVSWVSFRKIIQSELFET